MARSFTTNQQLTNASAVLTAAPLTMAAWGNRSSSANNHPILMLSTNSFFDYFALWYRETNKVDFDAVQGASGAPATSTTSISSSGWHHFAGVASSASSRSIYVDGVNENTNSTTSTPSGVNYTQIGSLAGVVYMEGLIAEAAIWSEALDAGEIAALAKGVSPLMVRPSALAAYWPLVGRTSPEIDLVGGFNLTLVNSPPAAEHSRIIMPPRLRPVTKIAAAAGSAAPAFVHHRKMQKAA